MTRTSAFRGTWVPNRRPYVVLAPDCYVSVQGQTSVIACGECRREVNINNYLTGVSTEGTVESPPGSATINLSIPDTDINNFYVDGQFVLITMMEIEIHAKGYYTVGGFPQYYRIFWGLISQVTPSWSDGVTTVTIQCVDILRWWELTNVIYNPAFLDTSKTQSGYQLFGNKFAGSNPYTVIIALAKEAMGDFSITTNSFLSFRPEYGAEQQVDAQYAKDIMAYWQLKFGNIWNSLVLYGTSGQAYTFAGDPGNVSPVKIAQQIFAQEAQNLALNQETSLFKIQPHEVAAFKVEVPRAGDVDFFQNETQSKLSIALTARDQAGGYEFYCDTTGDIVFKPPFYNLNVLPNKPVSWIQDFEIIDDSVTDSEREVYTHITSHGNAFGGVTDWGLNDDITTPRTGVIDWHLLKRYGWRRLDVQVEWAGNARRLFYHLLDQIDKINSKRFSGTITIPMRPELRQGFPVWIPKYDSFFYIQGISHQFSPGGQATSTLNLTAKRSKFIAPKNIGRITVTGGRTVSFTDRTTKEKVSQEQPTYSVEFPSNVGATTALDNIGQTAEYGGPAILRDPKTGKLLGFPNVVMTYRQSLDGTVLSRIAQSSGSTKAHQPTRQDQQKQNQGPDFTYDQVVRDVFRGLQNDQRAEIIDRLRINRYEAGMTNAGAYDYAHDVGGFFKEFSVVPADRVTWGAGTTDPNEGTVTRSTIFGTEEGRQQRREEIQGEVNSLTALEEAALARNKEAIRVKEEAQRVLNQFQKSNPPQGDQLSAEAAQLKVQVELADTELQAAKDELAGIRQQKAALRQESQSLKKLTSVNVMVRPVSDEFGFEVIGHYRYGRGTFIDRGQVQLPGPGEVSQNPQTAVNKLNIQFAAHGGALADPPTVGNLGQPAQDFASLFERMMPEDYVTGASFKGQNYQSGQGLEEVNPTGQRTYTDSINNTIGRAGRAVYAEADAVRRATTLAELSPTLGSGLDAVGYNKCACELGRANWLTVLPQSFIREIVGPITSVTSGGDDAARAAVRTDAIGEAIGQDAFQNLQDQGLIAPDGSIAVTADDPILGLTEADVAALRDIGAFDPLAEEEPQTIGVAGGSSFGVGSFALESPGGFFDVLRRYLQDKFSTDYRENQKREDFSRSGGRVVNRPDEGQQSDNLIGDPTDPVFQRAAQGDPEALAALQEDVNLQFGLTREGLANFRTLDDQDGPTDQLGRSIKGLPGSLYDAARGGLVNPVVLDPGASQAEVSQPTQPQFQPPARPPLVGEALNPSPSTQ